MNKTILGIVAAVVVAAAIWFGYNALRGNTPASTAVSTPAATQPTTQSALPEAMLTQVKTAVDAQLAAIPNVTPEQKTAVSTCVTTAVSTSVKPEDITKLATDTALQQKLATDMMTSVKDCMTKSGIGG
jgi:hypothetical protein